MNRILITTATLSPIIRWAIFIALALLALAVRLPRLAERPMHTDETVNAYTLGELLAGEKYHYDPQDRHGPVLYLLAKPLVRLGGTKTFAELTETQLRLTPVIVGSAMILLFGAAVEMFGFLACLIAALLFVFAPLPVYYSRYFIHETLFVAATFGLILSGGRALKTGSIGFAALAGLCAALMLGGKETAVIHFGALGGVLLAGWLLQRRAGLQASTGSENMLQRELQPSATGSLLKIIFTASAVFILGTILLFTWGGQNWQGLADLGRAIPRFAARAGGEGHEKPFGYYISLLDPLFVFFIVAAAGIYAAITDALAGPRKAGLLLAVYGLLIFLIYSAIPYKTPWLALNLWLPLALLCGLGVDAIWTQIKNATGRWIAGAAIAALIVVASQQTKTLVFDFPAAEKNPLAYAHTGEDVLRLPIRLAQLAEAQNLRPPRIAVVAADPWPLPWYLRKFSQVGYWQPGQATDPADFFITSTEAAGTLTAQLKNYRPEFFGVRPNVLMILWTLNPTTTASPPSAQP